MASPSRRFHKVRVNGAGPPPEAGQDLTGGPAVARSVWAELALLLDTHLERRFLRHAAARGGYCDLVGVHNLGVVGGPQRELGAADILGYGHVVFHDADPVRETA